MIGGKKIAARRFALCCVILTGVLLATAGTVAAGEPVSTLCFEAESAHGLCEPMQAAVPAGPHDPLYPAGKDASENAFLVIPQGQPKTVELSTAMAQLTFQVDVAARYQLWCRAWWPDECGNSFTMRIDDAPGFVFGQDGTFKRWHWVQAPARLKQLELAAGVHTLTILGREDGAMLDQVLLTRHKRRIPVDVEPTTAGLVEPREDDGKQP